MRYFFLITILLVLIGCKKEPTSWKNNIEAPLAYGSLNLKNLIQDDVLGENPDGTLQFIWKKELLTLKLDSLADIPDTAIINNFTINFSSITAAPGFEFVDDVKNFVINSTDIELKEVELGSGQVAIYLESPITDKTIYQILIPSATKDGVSFSKSYDVPAGSQASPSLIIDTISFEGYNFDLTGLNGTEVNTMKIQFKVMVALDAAGDVTITDQDVIKMSASFSNLKPNYARGYFGQHTFNENQTQKLQFMDQFIAGMIDVDAINFNLILENSFDIVARGKINSISNYNSFNNNNVFLTHAEFGQWININPTGGSWENLQPYTKTFNFSSGNSNIEAFLENIPQDLTIDFEGEVNPLGNTTGGHDEMFPKSKLALRLEADFPIRVGVSGLQLQDTFAINLKNDNETIQFKAGTITLEGVNNFPFSGELSLHVLDTINNALIPLNVSGSIPSPNLDANNKPIAPIDYQIVAELTEESLKAIEEFQNIIYRATLNTGGTTTIPIYSDSYINYKIKAIANTQISY